MAKTTRLATSVKSIRLDVKERELIDQKIKAEAFKFINLLVKMGFFANILAGLFYILATYRVNNFQILSYWYASLVAVNILNVAWTFYFERVGSTVKNMLVFRYGNLIIVGLICLIWGSIGVFFISHDLSQHTTTLIFLFSAIICFAFASSISLALGITGTICLITPTIIYHLSFLSNYKGTLTITDRLNLSTAGSFLIAGIFTIAACFIANKIVLKVLRLGYENKILRNKLETLNKSLEKRVKERTKELEKSLTLVTYQSTHDLLTELPNERMLYDEAKKASEKALVNNHKFAVVSFSINGQRMVSNSIGYEAANKITQRIGQRFVSLAKECPKYFVSLSRQDVFVLLIDPIKDAAEAEHYANNLFSLLNEPVYVSNQSLKLTASIGVSLYPDHGSNLDVLITNAGSARGIAAQRGGNSIRLYESVINADSYRQLNIENQLYFVIENNELFVNYQPFIDLETGTICGAEALVRWESPILGLISPVEFVPLAEANGTIIPIGEWVLRAACKQIKRLHKEGFTTFQMSLNLSARQLIQPNLVSIVEQTLREFNIDPRYLELELTESNAFMNEAIPIIDQFAQMGISLSIDDFGTGFSEFSSLKLFKVNKIKIDKSFVEDIDVNIDSRNIVCNTIALAKSMHIKCVAEGVETLEQVKFLRQNGCHIMQGYYFSKPLSADNFISFLKTHSIIEQDFN